MRGISGVIWGEALRGTGVSSAATGEAEADQPRTGRSVAGPVSAEGINGFSSVSHSALRAIRSMTTSPIPCKPQRAEQGKNGSNPFLDKTYRGRMEG